MIRSYITIALRNILRQKVYSVIKVAGLACGLGASLIIYLYILEDLSYDRFHENYPRIARLLTIDSAEGVSSKLVGVTFPAIGPAVEAELPEVLKSVRIGGGGRLDLSYEDNMLKCDAAFRTESSFFEIFNFPILEGKKEAVLDEPNSIAITQTLSKRLFGDINPIGKTVKLNQNLELHVVALLADPPKNSHLQFDLLRSLTPGQNEDGLRQFLQSWQSLSYFTYVLLDKPLDAADLNAKLKALATKNSATPVFTPVSQPLEDVHLRSKEILFETNANKSDVLNVYVLSIISGLIVVLAAVNFTNLVTAKATGRAKEVGMRKVIGAVRRQLIFQHLTESISITLISGLIAVVLVFATIPLLNNLYQRFAVPAMLLQPSTLLVLIGLVLVTGFVAGLYPAFVLSGLSPGIVLKGALKNSAGGVRLRKALVVLQFTISIALMVGTGIVYQQMEFIYTADLGYERDQVITIAQNGQNVQKATTLKAELLRNENIVSVGTASSRIGQQLGRGLIVPEGQSADVTTIVSAMTIDDTFIPTMGMEITAGRNFSVEFGDSLNVIINEELARLLKWNDPVGKRIGQNNGPNPTDLAYSTVVGVVKDFHFATIRHKLEPLAMYYNKNNGSLAVKVKAAGMKQAVAHIEETWKKINPGSPFEYAFLDDQFANLYRNEQAFASMFTHFTALAMIIAGLGLFALSAFTAEQRQKEIAIRKVLGASNAGLFFNLSSEFLVLISISFVMASTVAYFVMERWLQDFQYSIRIGAGIFVFSGVASVVIALATVSFQALKAALSNPVNSLRSE